MHQFDKKFKKVISLARLKLSKNKPSSISIVFEEKCNFKCVHCDIWKHNLDPSGKIMTFDEQKEVLLKLKKWLGEFRIDLAGGEQLLNKNLVPFIAFAKQNNILVHLSTNGYLLNPELAKELINAGLFSMAVSLDGITDQFTHDKTRGTVGAQKKAIEAVRILNDTRDKSNSFLTVATILMKQNIKEIAPLVEWVSKEKIDGIRFQPIYQNFASGIMDTNWFEKDPCWPDNFNEINDVINNLISDKNMGKPVLNTIGQLKRFQEYFRNPVTYTEKNSCDVGIGNLSICSDGNVFLCYEMPPIGNIFKDSLESMWSGPEAKRQRLAIKKCMHGCRILLCNDRSNLFDLVRNFVSQVLRAR